MATRLREELLDQVEEAEKEEPQREIPVIVTVTAGVDPGMMQDRGLEVQHVFRSISAVSGTLTAAKIRELAQLDQVESIEYDGTMRALSDQV